MSCPKTVDEVVREIMRIHRSLPPRPGIEQVEAAKILIRNIESEEQSKLEFVSKQVKGSQVPDELFMILQQMQTNWVAFESKEDKREALKLLDLDNAHQVFDQLIQRASECVDLGSKGDSRGGVSVSSEGFSNDYRASVVPSSSFLYEEGVNGSSKLFTRDDSYVSMSKSTVYGDGNGGGVRSRDGVVPMIVDSTLKSVTSTGNDGEKLSLMKLASLIEVSSKKGTQDLNLQGKLMDKIEWLPDSIGKLSSLTALDLSENRILALPATIGGLSSLTKLDLHSNKISELPDTIGDILSLVSLNLRGNQLVSLPSTLGRLVRLEELDLSANHLHVLPESIGSLVSLRILDVETNNIEEIPHTIANCSSLKELRADYNRLKALPEAVGRITSLEVLSARYNNVSRLPTTMASLASLRELDLSFNELESVPESLCLATTLVKMNISNNFADLHYLPRSIGNLELLEELDMSNNQIRVLPDSFSMLSKLRVLNVDGNPLEVPPRSVTAMGAQAVVQYIAELIAKRDVKSQPVKQKKSWASICFFSASNKRKRNASGSVLDAVT
ncbi:plant intracellular Ras-group-related LRR protein 4-like [Heracleum sosnowskyi]|uniref:Plant intracellular Ras-group-related LRR protein 4-like n=1 Tax=Heracleum sosnowskyi TaxID=360622 RepID=A0AAD8HMC8_9APIA|nr:plant intracellular Ras-group-related LRR protein 4-like [Heracleum sosnowskyi]